LNVIDFVTKLTKLVVIHGYHFRPALDHCIRHYQMMGKHTGVIHITGTKVEKYMWGHKMIQPWGEKLSLQCYQCGVLNPWSITCIKGDRNRPGYYSMECKMPTAGRQGVGKGIGSAIHLKFAVPQIVRL
jgi:hypothetical protein